MATIPTTKPGAAFDPDAFLAEPAPAPAQPFDPDAFLAGRASTPTSEVTPQDVADIGASRHSFAAGVVRESDALLAAKDQAQRQQFEQTWADTTGSASASPQMQADDAPLIYPEEARQQMARFGAQQRQQQAQRLKSLVELAPQTDPANEAQVAQLARRAGVTPEYVRANLSTWKTYGELNGWDADEWVKRNPEWAKRALEDPDIGTTALVWRERNVLDKGLAAIKRWYSDVAVDDAETQKIRAEATNAEAPRLQQQRETDFGRAVQAEESSFTRGALVAATSMDQARAGLQRSRLWWQYTLAANGLDSADSVEELRAKIDETSLTSTPVNVGDNEGGALGAIGDVYAGGAATAEQMVAQMAAQGAGGVAGGAIGGGGMAATAFVTAQPELYAEVPTAAAAGARLGMKVGQKLGATYSAYDMVRLEGGEVAEKLWNAKTETGVALTPREILGATVVAGVIAGALEHLGFEKSGGLTRGFLVGQIQRDPTLRKLLTRIAVEQAKNAGTEVLTEPAQGVVKEAVAYLTQSYVKAGTEGPDVDRSVSWDYSATDAANEAWGALTSSIVFGSGNAAIDLASSRVNDDARATANQAVPDIINMAASETAKARPDVFAQVVADATSSGGHPAITSLYVDGAAAMALYQREGSIAHETLQQMWGPEAAARVQEASATGGKLEVPLALVPDFFASELGQALKDSTTADPTSLSPRQQKTQGAEVEKAAQALFDNAVREMQAGADLEASLKAAEDGAAAALEEKLGKRQARQVARSQTAITRAFMVSQAEKAGKTVTELFRAAPVTFRAGTNKQVAEQQVADDFQAAVAADEATPAPVVDDTSFDVGALDEANAADQLAAQAAATEQERQQVLADFGLNKPEGIAAARQYLETFKPTVSAAERTAASEVARRAAQKASLTQQAARKQAMQSILDVAEGKAQTVTGNETALKEARALLRKRFGVVDNTGLDDILRRARGGIDDAADFRRKKRTGPVDETKRQEFLKNVLGRVSSTRVLRQADTTNEPEHVEPPNSESVRALRERFQKLTGEERTREYFIDPTTGVLNKRAFDMLDRNGRQFAVIAIEGIKYNNDSLGHDAGNAVYRSAAQALAPIVPEVAKIGGDFGAYVANDEQLQSWLKRANKDAVLEGYRLVGSVGDTLDAAFAQNGKRKAGLEKAGKRAAREHRPLGAKKLAKGEKNAALKGEAVKGTYISPELRIGLQKKFSPEQLEQQFQATYIEPTSGLFTKDGWDRLPRKRYIASFDFNGVKEYDKNLGKNATDALIIEVSKALRNLGAPEFDGAHVSGDEYLFQSDDREALAAFFDRIRPELASDVVPLVTDKGRKVEVHGLHFGVGIGETTAAKSAIDNAEDALNADKKRLTAAGIRGEGLALKRVKEVPDSGGAQRGAEGAIRGGAEAAAQGAPDVGRGEVQQPDAAQSERLNQTDEKNLVFARDQTTGAPKGYTSAHPEMQAMEGVVTAFLNQSADASTVIHEGAHGFMGWLQHLAAQPDATEATKKQWADATKALTGRTLTSEEFNALPEAERVAAHEKFARSFEEYVKEGKAPSTGLKRAFAAFSRWLLRIYAAVKTVPESQLNDDMRAVFDAMLTTQAEVKRARQQQGPRVAATQQQREEEDDDYTEGSYAQQLRAVKDALRRNEAWWKAEVKARAVEFGDAWEKLPAVQARKHAEAAGVVFDRAAVDAALKGRKLKGIRTVKEGGLKPDVLASLFNFATGEEMLKAIAALPADKETWVQGQVDAYMREKFPGVLDNIEEFRRQLAGDLHAATVKRVMSETKVTPAQRAAAEKAAELLVQRRTVRELRPAQALRAQRMAAEKKAAAMAKGDARAAALAAQQELLNLFLHQQLLEAEQGVAKFEQLASEMKKPAAVARLGKASPVYRDAAAFLLGELGLGAETDFNDSTLTQAVAQANGDAVLIGDPEWLEPVKQALKSGALVTRNRRGEEVRDFRGLNVAELAAVHDALLTLRAAARQRTTALVKGKRVEISDFREQLKREARENKEAVRPVGEKSLVAIAQRAAHRITGPLLKIETIVDWLGGSLVQPGKELDSAWHSLFVMLESARQHEADLQRRYAEPVMKAFHNMPAAVLNSFGQRIDGKALFPTHRLVLGLNADGSQKLTDEALTAPSTVGELFMMLLNAGNEENLQRLVDGRNITREQVFTAFNRYMTPAHIEAANAIGEAFETMWPEIQAMEERISGVKPKGVEKRPLQLEAGVLRGHYFPAIYDPRVSGPGINQSEQAQADAVASLFSPTIGRPQTTHGHRKARAELVYGAINLDAGSIGSHLAQHAHDLAFYERVGDVWRILDDRELRGVMNARLGYRRAEQVYQWVKDAARVADLSGSIAGGGFWSFLRKMQANQTIALLGYSVPNVAEDAMAPLAVAFDRDLQPSFYAKGLLGFFTPGSGGWDALAAKSKGLSTAEASVQGELARELKRIDQSSNGLVRAASRARDVLQAHAFAMNEVVFRYTAGPAWLGRYQQALAEGAGEAQAQEAANALVRRNWPSFHAVNASGVSRDVRLKPFVPFYGYFSTVVNKRLDEVQRVLEAPDAVSKARAAGRLLGFSLVASLLAPAVKELVRTRGAGPDEPPEEWALWTLLQGELGMLPFGGDFANTVHQVFGKGLRPSPRASAVSQSLIQPVVALKALTGDDPAEWKSIKAYLDALGLWFGLPTSTAKFGIETGAEAVGAPDR